MSRTAFSDLPADLRRLIRRGPAGDSASAGRGYSVEAGHPAERGSSVQAGHPAESLEPKLRSVPAQVAGNRATEADSAEFASAECVSGQKRDWVEYELPNQQGKIARASGLEFLDSLLPDAGFPLGQVTELAVNPRSSLGTRVALNVCRAAQQSQPAGEPMPWCAFIDASGSLYAPGVQATGVALDRLLVLRPEPDAVSRIAVKLAESNLFSVIVIDTVFERFFQSEVSSQELRSARPQARVVNDRLVRRLALAVHNTPTQILLLTDLNQAPGVALPVALRVELTRTHLTELQVGIVKDRFGRGGRTLRASLNAANGNANTLSSEVSQDFGGGVRSTRPRQGLKPRETVGAA
jgi:RecA/RadA recombinase